MYDVVSWRKPKVMLHSDACSLHFECNKLTFDTKFAPLDVTTQLNLK